MADYIWDGALDRFERNVCLPAGFIRSLAEEDDWGFVIKIHALYESALTRILATSCGDETLLDPFAKVSMRAKIAFCEAKNLFDPEDRKMLRAISELRNQIVHTVAGVGFAFSEYLKKPDNKNKFVKVFAPVWTNVLDFGDGLKVDRATFCVENPKFTVWAWCRRILACVYLQQERKQLDYEVSQFNKAQAARLKELLDEFKLKRSARET